MIEVIVESLCRGIGWARRMHGPPHRHRTEVCGRAERRLFPTSIEHYRHMPMRMPLHMPSHMTAHLYLFNTCHNTGVRTCVHTYPQIYINEYVTAAVAAISPSAISRCTCESSRAAAPIAPLRRCSMHWCTGAAVQQSVALGSSRAAVLQRRGTKSDATVNATVGAKHGLIKQLPSPRLGVPQPMPQIC